MKYIWGNGTYPFSTKPFNIVRRSSQSVQVQDGYINETHHIFGTYCHGIFDNDDLRRAIINALRKEKDWRRFLCSSVIANIKNRNLTVLPIRYENILI